MRRRLAAVAFFSALFGAVAVLLATRRGPGLSPDSTHYLSAGLNLAGGDGLVDFTGEPLTVFPPGLPVVVGLGQMLGLTAEWTIRLFNAGTVAGIVVVAFVLLRRHVGSDALVGLSTVLAVSSVPLITIARAAWTEPAFVLICLAFVLVIERLLLAERRAALLFAAVALVWLAFAFRYSGIALIPSGAIALFIGTRTEGPRRVVKFTVLFAALSALGPAAWMIRNYATDGTFLGPRAPSADGIVMIAKWFVGTIGSWVLPDPVPSSVQALAGVVLALLGVGAIWLLTRNRGGRCATLDRPGTSVVPLVSFVVIYSVYLVAAQLGTAIDKLSTRFMAPLHIPLLILAAMAVEHLGATVSFGKRPSVRFAATLLAAVFMVGQATVFAGTAWRAATQGYGYTTDEWQRSELADAVNGLPVDVRIYSNWPDGLWALLRRQPVYLSPANGAHRSTVIRAMPPEFLRAVACQTSYLAWFDRSRPYVFTPDELAEYVRLTVVRSASDGTLYHIEPLRAAGGSC